MRRSLKQLLGSNIQDIIQKFGAVTKVNLCGKYTPDKEIQYIEAGIFSDSIYCIFC